jgi:multiple sugar transport system substrate-binding protein
MAAESPRSLSGMTWDHPRAHQPLAAFDARARLGDIRVGWDRQSLADFEAHPIGDLAQRYDFMIIDHPGLGAAVQQQALLPLDEVFGPGELAGWRSKTVGPTWSSYRYAGHQWAIPIDAATQVTVRRPDLLPTAPTRWQDLPELAREVRITLCLGGPHAFLGLLGMCASTAGIRSGGTHRGEDGRLFDVTTATEALILLRALWWVGDQATSLLDPIGVHEAMAASSDLAYCPLAYGYARYAEPELGRHRLAWSAAPGWQDGPEGSVLGGTGLAVSRHSAERLDDIRAYVRAFLADDVQSDLVPASGGQPAHLAAWDSPSVDRRWGGYYSATRSSVESAWIRPRLPGWIGFQDRASELVREWVVGTAGGTALALADKLNQTFTEEFA